MEFIWDVHKNHTNFAKHRVSFELAAEVFADPLHVAIFDCVLDNEERWHAIGATRSAVVLLVVHTFRHYAGKEYNRIISARKATLRERRYYEQDINAHD